MKRVIWLLALGLMATPVLAQETRSCEEQLQEALVRVQLAERDGANARQSAAGDVVRWMNQARANMKAATEAKTPRPSEPSPETKPEGK